MGALVAVEGLDGAGKRTLTGALTTTLRARGARVATLAFPRYGLSVPADLVADALHGRVGDLGDSVYGMAVLFALDRSAAATELAGLLDAHDVVLLDRYTASNAAFGAARLHQDARGRFPDWVRKLEFDRLALPLPTLQVLLRVTVAVAAERAAQRAATEADRARDAFESDGDLQTRTAAVYDGLAADQWCSPWFVYAPAGGQSAVEVLAERVLHTVG